MKVNVITKTIEEVNGYIAEDGTWFKEKEQCQKYEESAKMVVFNMIKEKMIAKTNANHLLFEGSEDTDIEIFKVDSLETMELLNRYIALYSYSMPKENLIKEDAIGKNILLFWSYDHDCCWTYGSIVEMLEEIKKKYTKLVCPENKEREVK